MRYAVTLSLLGLALVAWSISHPAARWLLIWSAISVGVAAAGYAGVGACVFGKRSQGTIPLIHKIVNFPYLGYTWAAWHLFRLCSREPAFHPIDDYLVVGRRLLGGEAPEGFEHYIDLTAEFDEPAPIRARSSYRCLPILDAGTPTLDDLRQAVESCAEGRVYVHCALGHGRTGLFAVALLLRRGCAQTVEEALYLLRRVRPAVRLNREQEKTALRYLAFLNENNKPVNHFHEICPVAPS